MLYRLLDSPLARLTGVFALGGLAAGLAKAATDAFVAARVDGAITPVQAFSIEAVSVAFLVAFGVAVFGACIGGLRRAGVLRDGGSSARAALAGIAYPLALYGILEGIGSLLGKDSAVVLLLAVLWLLAYPAVVALPVAARREGSLHRAS